MSYWGNKLGQQAPPPPPPVERYSPDVLPRGMGNDTQSIQRAVNDYVSRLPGQTMAPPGYRPPGQVQQQVQPQWQPKSAAENPTNVSDVLPIWHWQGNPQGGAKDTATIGNCPACGSNNYFSRSSGGGVINTQTGIMATPAPECFECGYPRQQGTVDGSYTMAPGQAARQGANPLAPAGTIGTLVRPS